jgi:hypothetical protein
MPPLCGPFLELPHLLFGWRIHGAILSTLLWIVNVAYLINPLRFPAFLIPGNDNKGTSKKI